MMPMLDDKGEVMMTNGEPVFIRPSANNPKEGFIVLGHTTIKLNGNRVNGSTRTAYIAGPIALLEQVQADFEENGIDGRIRVMEYVKSEVPDRLLIKDKSTKQVDWKRMKPKRAGNEGPVLTKNGEPIYRFSEYNVDGEADIFVEHDNRDEVIAHREKEQAKAEAKAAAQAAKEQAKAAKAAALPK